MAVQLRAMGWTVEPPSDPAWSRFAAGYAAGHAARASLEQALAPILGDRWPGFAVIMDYAMLSGRWDEFVAALQSLLGREPGTE